MGPPGTGAKGLEGHIVINEVLVNPIGDQSVAVELRNTTSQDIAINHWYLSDSPDDLFKTQITTTTNVPAGAYHVLADLGLELNQAQGDEIWLLAADANGLPLSFVDRVEFGNSLSGVSLGPWPTLNDPFVQLAETTFGGPNSGPRVNEVIISEVSYAPVDPDGDGRLNPRDFEFVELYNHTDNPVDVSGWRLSVTDEFTFAEGTVMDPNSTLLVIGFGSASGSKLDAFLSTLGVDPTTPLVGRRMRSFLNDEDGLVQLHRPGTAPADRPELIPFVFADGLAFDRTAPWPESANGNGDSLTRVASNAFGALPGSWIGATPSPGVVDFVVRQLGDSNGSGVFDSSDLVPRLPTRGIRRRYRRQLNF